MPINKHSRRKNYGNSTQSNSNESLIGSNPALFTNFALDGVMGPELKSIVGNGYYNGTTLNAINDNSYAVGKLDLSRINSKADVEKLLGSGISATCTGCDSFYSIKFVDDDPTLGLNGGFKAFGNLKEGATFWIDISGCNNGEDVVDTVLSTFAKLNGATAIYDPDDPIAFSMGDQYTAGTEITSFTAYHNMAIGGSGSQLAFFDVRNKNAQTPRPEGTMDGGAAYGGFANGYVANAKPVTMEEKSISLHVGADSDSNNKINVKLGNISTAKLGLAGYEFNWRTEHVEWVNRADVSTAASATKCIDAVKKAIQEVSTQRSAFGAVQNRLEHTINNLDNVVENTTAAESQIRDTDMASEMVKFSNNNILAQAGQSMLAQANQVNQGILSLLR